jgi:hypothetical protein
VLKKVRFAKGMAGSLRLSGSSSEGVRGGLPTTRKLPMLALLPVSPRSAISDIATDGKSDQQSNYRSEMPIAAFSSGDASQYSYFSATLKSCCISSGVGGAGGLFGSNGRASSRKKL